MNVFGNARGPVRQVRLLMNDSTVFDAQYGRKRTGRVVNKINLIEQGVLLLNEGKSVLVPVFDDGKRHIVTAFADAFNYASSALFGIFQTNVIEFDSKSFSMC